MKKFTQPKNEPLLRKKRRPKEKAADLDLWMKEFTEQFIDVTFATGGEAPAAIEQFIDVTKATGGEAPGATEAVADEDGTLDALFFWTKTHTASTSVVLSSKNKPTRPRSSVRLSGATGEHFSFVSEMILILIFDFVVAK